MKRCAYWRYCMPFSVGWMYAQRWDTVSGRKIRKEQTAQQES